jgi:ATP-binding cassette subfamily F protein 3
VVISHDRAFLNAIATRVVEVRAGVLREFPGNYDDYLQRLQAEAGDGASPRAGRSPARSEAPSREPSGGERLRAERKAAERARRQLQKLEAEIATREAELAALDFRLADSSVWADPEQARRLSADREALQTTLRTLYPEWERLALEAERPASE